MQALQCKVYLNSEMLICFIYHRWFCHLDDDNYLNLHALLDLLSAFPHNTDVYVGRPSLDHPVETLDKIKGDGSVR